MINYGPVEIERWKPEESAADAYQLAEKIVVHGSCITTIGNFACEPYRCCSTSASDEEVGEIILEALATAKAQVSPSDPQESLKRGREKIFQAAGVRSWAKLFQKAFCCSVHQTPDRITILPSKREAKNVYAHIDHAAISLSAKSSASEVGSALRKAFSLCT